MHVDGIPRDGEDLGKAKKLQHPEDVPIMSDYVRLCPRVATLSVFNAVVLSKFNQFGLMPQPGNALCPANILGGTT